MTKDRILVQAKDCGCGQHAPSRPQALVASTGCQEYGLMKLPNPPNVTRRSFVASVGAATVLPPATALLANSAGAAVPHRDAPTPTEPSPPVYLFFTVGEARFSAADRARL